MRPLASLIGALVAAAVAASTVIANLDPQVTTIVVGGITLVASTLFPALKAQLDEAGGQLFAVIGVVVAAGLDALIAATNISEPIQATLVAIVTALAGLFVPAVHLQQASPHKPARPVANRLTG